MDYGKMLSKLLSKSEFESFEDPMRKWDDQSLFKHLIDVGVIRPFDWKHCEESDIYLFVDERMCSIASLGIDSLTINSSAATELYNEIHPNGKRNFVCFVLKHYNRLLSSTGLKVMTINRYDDSYYLVLVKTCDVSKLKLIKSDFWKFCDVK